MDERLDEPFVQRLITKTFDKLKIENDGDFCGMDVSTIKSKEEKRYAAKSFSGCGTLSSACFKAILSVLLHTVSFQVFRSLSVSLVNMQIDS